MDYIEKMLGVKVNHGPWAMSGKLPYYLTERYQMESVAIGSVHTIFLYPKGELEQIGTLQKHISRIQKEEQLPVVLVLAAVNRHRRNALLDAHIPFVVPEKQLYLPFLGTYLQERFDAETPAAETLSPAAQVLFFYYLYQREPELYISRVQFPYTPMTISRAARQLVQTGLFAERKDGVQKVLFSSLPPKDLFLQMRPRLINPVRERGFLPAAEVDEAFFDAGESALAQKTMLNPPVIPCYAVDGKNRRVLHPCDVEPGKYAAVELWRYDPKMLSKDGTVDSLSLIVSLDASDERLEIEIEELLNKTLED